MRKHSGYSRVQWIGYGFGAQLGLGYAAIHGAHQLASLISLCGRLALPKRDTYLGTMLHVFPSLVGGPDCVPKSRLERWPACGLTNASRMETLNLEPQRCGRVQ